MKKSLVVLLIAVLVAGSAFATVSGSASFSFGYDLEDEEFAVLNDKAGAFDFSMTLDTDSAATAAGTKAVYAKAGLSATAAIDGEAISCTVALDEAYVMGEGWKVDFTSVANGLKLEALGGSLSAWYKQAGDWGVAVETPEVALADGLTISAKAGYAQSQYDKTNVDNWALDIDLDDDYEDWLDTYEDGTYVQEYLQNKVTSKTDLKKAYKAAKAAYVADPNRVTYKAYANALDDYNDAIAALDYALTEAGMLKAWANGGFASNTNIDTYYSVGKTKVFNSDYGTVDAWDSSAGSLEGCYEDSNYAYVTKTTATEYSFLGSEVIDASVKVAYAKDLASASVEGGIVVTNYAGYDDQDLEWNANGAIGYDFFKANAGIDSDKVLSAGINLDLTKFVGYAFTFDVAGTDLLEKDSDEEIDRVLSFGFDTVVADLTFGFDGAVNFTDEAVAFGFDSEYAGFTFGMDWTTEYGESFNAIDDKAWTLGVDLGYACDYVTAKAGVAIANVGVDADDDHNYTDTEAQVKVNASVESKALIENATVGIAFTDAVYNGLDDDQDKGAITASIKVAF